MDDYIIYDGELYHYGRKGMKWGQHIFGKVKSGAKKVGQKAKAAHEKRKEIRANEKLRKKPLSKLTDDELKRRLERLDLEKRVSELSKATKTTSAGKQFIDNFAKKALGESITNSAQTALTAFLTKKFKNSLGIDLKDVTNSMDLLKKFNINDLNDEQISRMAKRAENIDSINKKLLGKNNDDKTDDGTNSNKKYKDKSIEDMTDAEIKTERNRRENENALRKLRGENDSSNNNDSTKTKDDSSDSSNNNDSTKTKTKTDRISKLINKGVDDLTEAELDELNEYYKRLGL